MWFYGSIVLWFCCSIDLWIYSSVVLLVYGPVVLYSSAGSIALWFCGSMVLLFYGSVLHSVAGDHATPIMHQEVTSPLSMRRFYHLNAAAGLVGRVAQASATCGSAATCWVCMLGPLVVL